MDVIMEAARPADDPAILRMLADHPVPGRVAVSFEREPSIFAGARTWGRDPGVYVARATPSGEVAGVACRAVRRVYVNGVPEEIGYLGQLRIARRWQGRWILPAAFRFLRELHAKAPVRGYITTITEENAVSRRLLAERPRPSLPVYTEVSRLRTLVLPVPRKGRRRIDGAVRHGPGLPLRAVLDALARLGPGRQFAPVWSANDFAPGSAATPGFRTEDFVMVEESDGAVAVAGLWDQSGFKQSVVRGYGGWLGAVRPLVNAAARLRGLPPLPAPGQPLRLGYAAFLAVQPSRERALRPLMRALLLRAAEHGLDWLVAGFAEGDPRLSVVASFPHVAYVSRLYTVTMDGQPPFHRELDGRPCDPDVATL